MSNYPYDALYEAGNIPWETGDADERLLDLVRSGGARPGRALDIGCGAGTNAIWLAQHGFDVLGVDVSSVAIKIANAKITAAAPRCRFSVVDFMHDELPPNDFQLVFDRGCFHLFDEAHERARFAERVAGVLAPDGVWLSLIGSTEGAARDGGPPRRSARDVVEAIEPFLEIVELRSSVIMLRGNVATEAWACVARRRATPAQPSTSQ